MLVQAMDSANFDEPDSNFWYAFGRVAEQASERVALTDYARVTSPKDPLRSPRLLLPLGTDSPQGARTTGQMNL